MSVPAAQPQNTNNYPLHIFGDQPSALKSNNLALNTTGWLAWNIVSLALVVPFLMDVTLHAFTGFSLAEYTISFFAGTKNGSVDSGVDFDERHEQLALDKMVTDETKETELNKRSLVEELSTAESCIKAKMPPITVEISASQGAEATKADPQTLVKDSILEVNAPDANVLSTVAKQGDTEEQTSGVTKQPAVDTKSKEGSKENAKSENPSDSNKSDLTSDTGKEYREQLI